MRLPASLGLLVTLLLSTVGVVGCSETSTNDAPIVDYVDAPLVVSAENGHYRIPVTIGFHDNDSEVVTRVHYRVAPSIDEIIEITTPIPTSQSADVVLVIPAPMTGSTDERQVQITVIDGRGAESLPLPQAVTFH